MFNACAQLRTPAALTIVHKISSTMPKAFPSNPMVATSLLDALMKCGEVKPAEKLFHEVKNQWFANVSGNDERWFDISIYEVLHWSKLPISGYTFNNQAIKAVELFQDLERRRFFFKNHPQSGSNWITYLCLINALSKLGDSSMAECLLKNMPSSFMEMRFIANSLVDMWVRITSFMTVDDDFLHSLNDFSSRAKLVTSTDRKKSSEDFLIPITLVMQQWVSGNKLCVVRIFPFILVIVNTLGLNGMGAEAIELYVHTPEHLRNNYTHLCVITACSHSGLVTKARVLFKEIPEKNRYDRYSDGMKHDWFIDRTSWRISMPCQRS